MTKDSSQPSCSVELLRTVPELADVPADQLKWFLENAECTSMKRDEVLFKPGDPIDYLRVVIQGKMRFYQIQKDSMRTIGEFEAPYITGVLPYSRLKESTGHGVVLEDALFLLLHRDRFPEMIQQQYELTAAFVHYMTSRVRSFTTFQLQNEKLMSLGKLSAGLAHELNNPASAVVRSAQELKKHLQMTPQGFKKVTALRMEPEVVDSLNTMLLEKVAALDDVQELSLMDRTDREDELADWLEDHGVEDGYEFSADLVDFGFEVSDLESVLAQTADHQFEPVLSWIHSNLVTEKMVRDIQDASERISELVKSVKSYTHMDQSQDNQTVDLHKGIKNTITMLQHKIRKNNMVIEKDLSAELPRIEGYPGEINQVFTNVIDNAMDATAEVSEPRITIKTTTDGEFVRVFIQDNGPGIPEDILQRIFDPFFTTKSVGEGTGMGLDVVKKIMEHHNGKVVVNSEPGKTVFELCFPIKS